MLGIPGDPQGFLLLSFGLPRDPHTPYHPLDAYISPKDSEAQVGPGCTNGASYKPTICEYNANIMRRLPPGNLVKCNGIPFGESLGSLFNSILESRRIPIIARSGTIVIPKDP